MRETEADLAWMQELLDRTYESAGSHLREIHTDEARLDAREVTARLDGMRVIVVATVTEDGRPRTGPLDSFLYRGRLHFGTSPEAFRARHLARSPEVSATYVEGEGLVVTVHGRARPVDLRGEDAGFADVLREKYGPGWEEWGLDAPYFVIEPDRMYAADMRVHTAGSDDGTATEEA